MLIEPTYTAKQFWSTILLAGILLSILSIIIYVSLYWFLYVPHSFLFSLIYFIPLFGSAITISFFKYKYVWNEFTYSSAFKMSFFTSQISNVLFCIFLFIIYNLGLESRIDLFNTDNCNNLQKLMSPCAISISMFIINLFLSVFFSFIIAIFAKRKKTI